MTSHNINAERITTKHCCDRSFTALFEKFEKPLFEFSVKITKSMQLSSDIVQDVFLKLWEHRDEIQSIENMEAWLHKSAKNKIIDNIRKMAADERLRENVWQNMCNSSLDTQHLADTREYDRLMARAIQSLPEKRRTVYLLRREHGLNYDQISRELSISPHTVKNQMTVAIRSIQRFVTGSLGLMLLTLFK
jgi:RNA polymerase sigma-70 factor (ECF subfamily)